MKKTSSACRAGWCDREPLTAAAAAAGRRCRAQLLDVQPPEAAHADGRLRQRLGARPPPWRVGGPAPPAILLAFYRPYWFTTAECTAFPWPFTAAPRGVAARHRVRSTTGSVQTTLNSAGRYSAADCATETARSGRKRLTTRSAISGSVTAMVAAADSRDGRGG